MLEFSKEDLKICKKVKFPDINFKEHFLVGFKGFTYGCELPDLNASAIIEDENLVLKLSISKVGDCKNEKEVVYWGLIEKKYFTKGMKLEVDESYQ